MKAHIIAALGLISLVGCTHSIHLSHVSDIDPVQGKTHQVVSAETEQAVFMGFVFDTDYVDQARDQLIAACDGHLAGVNTQYSTSHGFFSWTNYIRMKGICIKN